MKRLNYIVIFAALLLPAAAFGQSNLDKFKAEAKQEQAALKCPLTEPQELRIYKYLKRFMYDFNSLEVLQWGTVKTWPDSNGCFTIKVRVKGNTPVGNNIAVYSFFFDQNGNMTLDDPEK